MTNLSGVEAKIERAAEHINALNTEIAKVLAPELYVVTHETEPQSGNQIWRLDSDPPVIPDSMSTLVGDILHNLRSALDLLVWQLVLVNGNKPNSRNAFPIFSDTSLYVRGKETKLKGVSSAAIAVIDRFQPCNRALYEWELLNVLGNIDKHRHLLGVSCTTTWASVFGPRVELHVSNKCLSPFTGPLERGTILLTARTDDVEVYFNPTIHIALSDVHGLDTDPLGWPMTRLLTVVRDAVQDDFRCFFT